MQSRNAAAFIVRREQRSIVCHNESETEGAMKKKGEINDWSGREGGGE